MTIYNVYTICSFAALGKLLLSASRSIGLMVSLTLPVPGGALFGFDISSMSGKRPSKSPVIFRIRQWLIQCTGVLGTEAYKRYFHNPRASVQGVRLNLSGTQAQTEWLTGKRGSRLPCQLAHFSVRSCHHFLRIGILDEVSFCSEIYSFFSRDLPYTAAIQIAGAIFIFGAMYVLPKP
jgi:hypothetical protein